MDIVQRVRKTMKGVVVQPDVAMAVVRPMVETVLQRVRYDKVPLFAGALRNFQNWQASLVRGNTEDDRPPIWKDAPRAEVKEMLDSRVNRHAQLVRSVDSRVPSFSRDWVKVETGQAESLGPSSEYPSFLLDGDYRVQMVFSDKPLSKLHYSPKALDLALRDLSNMLPAGSIRATSQNAVRPSSSDDASPSRLDGSTNTGYPAFMRDWFKLTRNDPSHVEYREWLTQEVKSFIERCYRASSWESVVPSYTGVTGQRVVAKGPDPFKPSDHNGHKIYKVRRIVIAMPKTETWPDKMVFVPVQQALLRIRNPRVPVRVFSGWLPMQQLDKNMYALLDHATSNKRTVVCGDLSNFDATIPPELWWKVKLAMSKWMEPNTARMFLASSWAGIYNTGCLTPTKYWEPQPSSVKSGSMFTNLDYILVNWVTQRYGYYAGYYGEPIIVVNGDDGLTDAPGATPAGVEQAFADLGMVMNAEKAYYEFATLHFLQRLWCNGIPGGMGSVYRVLNKCLGVEDDTQLRYDERNRYAYAVQAIARLENCCFNPMFEELVDLMALGDQRLHLGRFMSAKQVASGAGDYAQRKFVSSARQVWSPAGSGVPFEDWATNRVLRGEKLPPVGDGRWHAIYRRRFSSVPL